jgi:hypothetical protein
MGCDIHLYREKLVEGKWAAADKWTLYDNGEHDRGTHVEYNDLAYSDRNYDLFGLLAYGVRREFEFSFLPRGMPLVCCPQVEQHATEYGEDGHNHSYLYLHELRELQQWCKANTMPVSGMMAADQWAKLSESIASGSPNWELIYPYCQGTTDRTYVRFEVEVPMDFNVGEGLAKIIDSFAGIDGENHRVVFWFDN